MYALTDLRQLPAGESARITGLLSVGGMRQRLLDIGLIEGAPVECLFRKREGPAAFLIRGTAFALRPEDCADVLIRKEEDSHD